VGRRSSAKLHEITAHTESRQVATNVFSSIRVLLLSGVRRIVAATLLYGVGFRSACYTPFCFAIYITRNTMQPFKNVMKLFGKALVFSPRCLISEL